MKREKSSWGTSTPSGSKIREFLGNYDRKEIVTDRQTVLIIDRRTDKVIGKFPFYDEVRFKKHLIDLLAMIMWCWATNVCLDFARR